MMVFFEEADSLQRRVVSPVFNIEASRQLRKIIELFSFTNGMSWRKLTTNSQCPQGVILNLKPPGDSPSSCGREYEGEKIIKDEQLRQNNSEQQRSNSSENSRSQSSTPCLDRPPCDTRVMSERESEQCEPVEEQPKGSPDPGDEQKWKKEMEHMRFDFKLSRKLDFKIHNFEPNKKRPAPDDKGTKRVKGSAQGKFFHIKMSKDFQNDAEKKQQCPPSTAQPPPIEEGAEGAKQGNLQDFLQKITIPMDKLN